MSDQISSISDLLAPTHGTQQTVRERIERRLIVLRAWKTDEIPAGKILPKSLNIARLWSDAELGIQKIASPNEFTTRHPQHGPQVSAIEKLLKELNTLYSKPAKRASNPKSDVTKEFDRKAAEEQLITVCSQWHSERSRRLQDKERADSAEARSIVILEENAKMETLIADLRRQIASQMGLKVVE